MVVAPLFKRIPDLRSLSLGPTWQHALWERASATLRTKDMSEWQPQIIDSLRVPSSPNIWTLTGRVIHTSAGR